MDQLETVRRRIATQRLGEKKFDSAVEAVRSMGAVQAQEFAEVKWSLAERMRGEPTDAEIEREFAAGEIIRTHVLRPTWHFVAPEDLRWMLELSAPRVRMAMAYYDRQLGLDEEAFERSAEILARFLAGGKPRTRKELGEALAAGGIEDPKGGRLNHLVMYAELHAVLCSGPRRGKQHTYLLVDEAIPASKPLTRGDALAELARRFFASHGPATIEDFSWWSGLTKTDCRAGIKAVEDELSRETDANDEPWWGPKPKAKPARGTGAQLIPTYDELSVGYQSLRMVNGSPPAEAVTRPILFDGICFGGWKRTLERGGVTVEAATFKRLSRAHRAELEEVAGRFGRFLELPVKLETGVG